MRIGIQFHVTAHTIDAVTLGKAIEERGFESYWAPEHTVMPAKPAKAFPMTGGEIPAVYGQMADPFVTLSMIAAVTSNLMIGTSVCLVPDHHPLSLANTVGTLDNFSGGRLLLGVGTGWLPEITSLFGPYAETPWKFTREAVEAMRALWREGVAGYSGELVSFPPVVCEPMPIQRPYPPVIIGSRGSELAFRRVARWGDGWITMGSTPEKVAEARRAITEECEKIGRDPAEVEITVGIRDASPEVREAYEAVGADRLIVSIYNHPGVPVPMASWREVGAQTLAAEPPAAADTMRALDLIHRQVQS